MAKHIRPMCLAILEPKVPLFIVPPIRSFIRRAHIGWTPWEASCDILASVSMTCSCPSLRKL